MMKTPLSPFQSLMVVIASFVVASVINIYPMSLEASLLRPMALIMVLIFWLMYKPNYVGVVTAFAIGILSDLLLDTRLGQQAFAAVVMAFSVRFMGQYIKQLNLSIAWAVASVALIVFQLTLWAVQYLTQNIFFTSALFSLLVSIVTWPLVYLSLNYFIKKY
ncbi:rod shape-determining protein MreD [Psychrobacter phenylpyruvicus]|uniref:Rod shape-determining protein mreD n=1 Tax=Psychrobacter phenylpyruvicus TaxID=29432 RepID=A0A379LP15_9GAMM|nr:rod shape-determining protein MreD [Psychrobacter phenylpyruvicus]SUD91607.1 Rod shape-determining protein mreD [Psychrobacter phenylpyruvicus]